MNKLSDNISHGKPSAGLNPLKASQLSDAANIQTSTEEAKERLKTLAERWKGINDVKGFLKDIWWALGIQGNGRQQKGGNPSQYVAFRLNDGSTIVITVRASAHNADADNYNHIGHINGDSNLSLVLQRRWHKNSFIPSDSVVLDEYVYVNSRISNVESPLSQIANALIGYLTNGKYVDTTGAAFVHHSPSNKVALKESDIKGIVKECVKKILLTEKYYNPATEPMVDYKLGDYDVLYGVEEKQIICDLPQKGWVEDIVMYSAMPKGKTYALYRRCDNGKYFFVEIMVLPKDKKYLHAKVISPKSVPSIIWNDARGVVRRNQILRDICI